MRNSSSNGGEEPDLLAELARAYGRLGKITGVVGSKNEAVALFEQAIPIVVEERHALGEHLAEVAGRIGGREL